MTACQQCGKPAFSLVGPTNIPLCIDCDFKLTQMMTIKNQELERQYNLLAAEIEHTVGLPGFIPRYPPRQPSMNVEKATFHNISVNNSTVGLINTGQLRQIDSSISMVAKQPGGHQVAEAIGKLTTAIANENGLNDQIRNEAVELVGAIASEAERKSPERRQGLIKTILPRLGELLQAGAASLEIWKWAEPIVRAHFGI